MAIRFDTFNGRAIIAEDFISSGAHPVMQASGQLRAGETRQGNLVGFKFSGELLNEDKIILGGEEVARLSIKGHSSKKDGVLACQFATKAVAKRDASLSERLAALEQRVRHIATGQISAILTLAVTLPKKLKQEPSEFHRRPVERVNRLDGVNFIFADESRLSL